MNVNVLSWNVCNGLGDNERASSIKEQVLSLEPDIAVFSEARSGDVELTDRVISTFLSEGFEVSDIDYDDKDQRRDSHGLVVISRPEYVSAVSPVTLAGREALMLTLDGDAQLIGAHFVDRTAVNNGQSSVGGEIQRVAQAEAAIDYVGNRAIVAGDLNAMHGQDPIARRLRAMGGLAKLLPSIEPGIVNKSKFEKLVKRPGSITQRLANMATGDTLRTFEAAGFEDADPEHQPTMSKAGIKVQLDHVLVRGIEIAVPTQVHSANGLSDHDIITTTVNL